VAEECSGKEEKDKEEDSPEVKSAKESSGAASTCSQKTEDPVEKHIKDVDTDPKCKTMMCSHVMLFLKIQSE
jgi:hypothetical protein